MRTIAQKVGWVAGDMSLAIVRSKASTSRMLEWVAALRWCADQIETKFLPSTRSGENP